VNRSKPAWRFAYAGFSFAENIFWQKKPTNLYDQALAKVLSQAPEVGLVLQAASTRVQP
jgi:hypothetical protein